VSVRGSARKIVSFDWDNLWEEEYMVSETEAAIREAAKPLVEALERMIAARNIQERIDAPEAARRALAAWKEATDDN
jgi:hypothetical protein